MKSKQKGDLQSLWFKVGAYNYLLEPNLSSLFINLRLLHNISIYKKYVNIINSFNFITIWALRNFLQFRLLVRLRYNCFAVAELLLNILFLWYLSYQLENRVSERGKRSAIPTIILCTDSSLLYSFLFTSARSFKEKHVRCHIRRSSFL